MMISPVCASNAHETTVRAWTSRPTLVRSNIAGTSKFQMWLYLSAKCGRQPTPCFEKEVPAPKPHFLGLLTEAISAGNRIQSVHRPPSGTEPRKSWTLRIRSGDNGLQKDQARSSSGGPPPPATYRLDRLHVRTALGATCHWLQAVYVRVARAILKKVRQACDNHAGHCAHAVDAGFVQLRNADPV